MARTFEFVLHFVTCKVRYSCSITKPDDYYYYASTILHHLIPSWKQSDFSTNVIVEWDTDAFNYTLPH